MQINKDGPTMKKSYKLISSHDNTEVSRQFDGTVLSLLASFGSRTEHYQCHKRGIYKSFRRTYKPEGLVKSMIGESIIQRITF